MPTMLWFPEVLEQAENFEKFFLDPNNKVIKFYNKRY